MLIYTVTSYSNRKVHSALFCAYVLSLVLPKSIFYWLPSKISESNYCWLRISSALNQMACHPRYFCFIILLLKGKGYSEVTTEKLTGTRYFCLNMNHNIYMTFLTFLLTTSLVCFNISQSYTKKLMVQGQRTRFTVSDHFAITVTSHERHTVSNYQQLGSLHNRMLRLTSPEFRSTGPFCGRGLVMRLAFPCHYVNCLNIEPSSIIFLKPMYTMSHVAIDASTYLFWPYLVRNTFPPNNSSKPKNTQRIPLKYEIWSR